jgi:predicted DNA-binding antitoxin AbrB/MazE fold protein
MARQLEAVYEQGILRPLEPLVLAEHQRVQLSIEERPERHGNETIPPVNERREEIKWLAKEAAPYAGEWVALDGYCLVAHGERLAAVRTSAQAAGVIEPLFARVPRTKTFHSAAARSCIAWNSLESMTILVRTRLS